MKATRTEKVILSLAAIILIIAAILYSLQPTKQAQAVEFTAGTEAEQAHVTKEPITWADAYHYAPKNKPALIGDCLADRVTGDLYPQPDPYCLPVPSVTVTETIKRDTDDTDTPVIVDMPATPETPVIEPTEEPETPEQPETPSNPEQPTKDKKHCDKGEGNGSEGCDPGNHPENGNNDEDAGKEKKEKKNK